MISDLIFGSQNFRSGDAKGFWWFYWMWTFASQIRRLKAQGWFQIQDVLFDFTSYDDPVWTKCLFTTNVVIIVGVFVLLWISLCCEFCIALSLGLGMLPAKLLGDTISRQTSHASGLATSHLLVVELSMQGFSPCVVARDPMSQAWGAPAHSFVFGLGRTPKIKNNFKK